MVMISSGQIFHACSSCSLRCPKSQEVSHDFQDGEQSCCGCCFRCASIVHPKFPLKTAPSVAGCASSSCWWLLALWLLPGYWSFPVLRLVVTLEVLHVSTFLRRGRAGLLPETSTEGP